MNTAGLTSSLYPSPMIARTFSQEVVGVGEILMQQFWFLQLYAYVCDSLVIVCRRCRPLASSMAEQRAPSDWDWGLSTPPFLREAFPLGAACPLIAL